MKVKVNKKIKLISILLVLVMLISVGYALLSTTLTIDGTVNVAATSWKIYFTNVQPTTGSVTPTTAPTTEGTTTTEITWEVDLEEPGDFYEFTVDAVNAGTIDAMINTATADIVTSSLTAKQSEYVSYSITYSDGAPVEQYDRLAANSTETLKIRVEFKEDVDPEDLPETDQEIIITYAADYVQADGNAKDRETVEPPVEPQLLQFYISVNRGKSGHNYDFLTGMTWQEFVESEYNTDTDFAVSGGNVLYKNNVVYVENTSDAVSPDDIIDASIIYSDWTM